MTKLVPSSLFFCYSVSPLALNARRGGAGWGWGQVTYINTPMIDEDNEMELIQKQYEKAEKKRKKSLEKEAKEASEQRMRLPQIKNMTAKLKKELLEKIATSCGKCGNSEPLLDIPQKDYDVLFREHMMQVHGEKDVTALQSEYDAEMLLKYKNAKTKVVDGKTRYICTKCPEPLLSFEAYRDHAQWHAEIVEREKNFRNGFIRINFTVFYLIFFIQRKVRRNRRTPARKKTVIAFSPASWASGIT